MRRSVEKNSSSSLLWLSFGDKIVDWKTPVSAWQRRKERLFVTHSREENVLSDPVVISRFCRHLLSSRILFSTSELQKELTDFLLSFIIESRFLFSDTPQTILFVPWRMPVLKCPYLSQLTLQQIRAATPGILTIGARSCPIFARFIRTSTTYAQHPGSKIRSSLNFDEIQTIHEKIHAEKPLKPSSEGKIFVTVAELEDSSFSHRMWRSALSILENSTNRSASCEYRPRCHRDQPTIEQRILFASRSESVVQVWSILRRENWSEETR